MVPLHEGNKDQFKSSSQLFKFSTIENQEKYTEFLIRSECIVSPKIYYHTECTIQCNNKISSSVKISVMSDWYHLEYCQETFNDTSSTIEEDIFKINNRQNK